MGGRYVEDVRIGGRIIGVQGSGYRGTRIIEYLIIEGSGVSRDGDLDNTIGTIATGRIGCYGRGHIDEIERSDDMLDGNATVGYGIEYFIGIGTRCRQDDIGRIGHYRTTWQFGIGVCPRARQHVYLYGLLSVDTVDGRRYQVRCRGDLVPGKNRHYRGIGTSIGILDDNGNRGRSEGNLEGIARLEIGPAIETIDIGSGSGGVARCGIVDRHRNGAGGIVTTEG